MTTDTVISKRAPRPLDRLSSLPNELVDAIFDAAYSFARPSAPLSKRLYPFFERRVYRNVVLRSPGHFHAFSRVLDLHPDRGQLVSTLVVRSFDSFDDGPSKVSLNKLLSRVLNLVSLELPVGPNQYLEPLPATMNRLTRVTSVSAVIHCSYNSQFYESQFRLSDFASLSALPNLDELHVTNWAEKTFDENFQCQGTTRFRSVATLSVKGYGADQPSVAHLVNLCPELLHLELRSSWNELLEFPTLLPLLPTTLQSLRLDAPDADFTRCDSFLPRFSQLRKLDLGVRCHSQTIHTTLAQLPNLVHLTLGTSCVDFEGLSSLLSGPSRLVDLKSITLNTDFLMNEHHGSRTLAPSHLAFSAEQAESGMLDWTDPDNYFEDLSGFDNLLRACEASGVEFDGTLLDVRESVKDFYLEAMNRAVVRTWLRLKRDLRGFEVVREAREEASRAGVPLPRLDFDSLELDNLDIVEIPLPDKDWFVLSLKNKAKAEGKRVGDKVIKRLEPGACSERKTNDGSSVRGSGRRGRI